MCVGACVGVCVGACVGVCVGVVGMGVWGCVGVCGAGWQCVVGDAKVEHVYYTGKFDTSVSNVKSQDALHLLGHL